MATVIGAELSPGPLALDATTRKVYLVSGTRFWMVTCISPGPLVFSTRSLRAKQQQYEIKKVQTCQMYDIRPVRHVNADVSSLKMCPRMHQDVIHNTSAGYSGYQHKVPSTEIF